MDKIIKIYHTDWSDDLSINFDKNIIIRKNYNNDFGNFILIDNLLLIKWEKWGKEYFFLNNNEYYQICDNNYFNLDYHISIIYLIDEINSNKYIIDINLQKIYILDNLEFYGNFIFDNNDLIINLNQNNSTYIFFNNKYYNKTFIDKKYKIIYIDNKRYFLDKNSNISYENNILNKNNYLIYKNKLKFLDDITIYFSKNNIDNYIKYTKNNTNNIFLKNLNNIDKYINKNNKIFINIDNILNIISLIEYYIYFNINYIIFDHINNIEYNNIFGNINIIYYNDIDELSNLFINCKDYNIYNIYINSIEKIWNEHINNKNLIYYNNKLFKYDLLYNCEIDLKKLWYKLNKNKLKNFDYLLNINNNKIPKIMHFVWLGNNKLPDIYLDYIESWIKNHKDWIFCFWNDNNIPILINQKYYDQTNVYAMKADILRYELLYFFGGVYIDCDFLCIKNIDNIIENYIGFSGNESEEYIAIGLMGFIHYDIILYNIIKNISYNIDNNKSTYIPQLTGPIFFTKLWNIYKTNLHYSFPINYFYSYLINYKLNNLGYTIDNNNYAIHMWGHSWDENKIKEQKIYNGPYYLSHFYLSNLINDFNKIIQKIKYNDISNYLRNKIFFKVNKNTERKKIVHIMGLFFTGGIERYLHYIDKYGNHEKYNYYLIYISNGNYVYNIQNMHMISFDWNNKDLNALLIFIKPDLIIDHYSIYINENIYKNLNNNNIIYFIHSAICYNNDISYLSSTKCINLYNEQKKHFSWNNILYNYYLTLGTEINSKKIIKYKKNNKIKISIIGRIAEEKLGINFLKKLCILSNEKFNEIIINIYGEKDKIFNIEYTKLFEEELKKSKIVYHNFVNPLNMESIYLTTNILLIPSAYETGSFTCIEAFSYGIPVIARNVYGLKYMIKNNVTGYLCDSDDDIINKLIDIKNDQIINNTDIIKEESLKYNIINKIKDLEYIIDKNIINKNLVIITSVINCVDKPLSYYYKRSIFDINERYKHTLKSIESIKKYIKNAEILFCECSDLSNNIDIENNIKNNVDYYYNFYQIRNVRNNVESELKGLGEVSILLEGLNKLEKINKNYINIFKLSGRYFLNHNFDYQVFDNNLNIFTKWDNSNYSYCTVFYKINSDYIDYYKNILVKSIEDLNNKNSIEMCMYKYFQENINIVDKMNVSGFLATEGYLFSV
jgi:mannosyltransferase OCH1-like enzyme/glycosyltransferase involved in cell wall biosynthesis